MGRFMSDQTNLVFKDFVAASFVATYASAQNISTPATTARQEIMAACNTVRESVQLVLRDLESGSYPDADLRAESILARDPPMVVQQCLLTIHAAIPVLKADAERLSTEKTSQETPSENASQRANEAPVWQQARERVKERRAEQAKFEQEKK